LQLRRPVQAFNPDLVHAFGLETGNATIAGHLGYLSTCFVQGIVQKLAPFLEHCSPAYLNVLERLERQAVPRMQGFVAETEFARKWVLSVDPRANVVNIPHAVNREFIEQGKPDFAQCRFLTVGSIDSLKGTDPLIRAFARARHPARRLTIAGDGPLLPVCRELVKSLGIQDRVEFTGAVPRKEIIRLMTNSRALVHAARMDTSPNVITEAHSIGLPVLATRAGGIPEMIDEGRDGFLVAIDDLEAMAERMDRMAAAPELCRTMGAAGRAKVIRLNDPATVASAHADFFRRIVAEYGSAGGRA
jgi:glycosyltransferase involved in cell wall biosynthesis